MPLFVYSIGHWIPTGNLWSWLYYYPHFTDEETDSLRVTHWSVNSSIRIDLRSSWIHRSLLARSPGCLSPTLVCDQDPALISPLLRIFRASHYLWGEVQMFWNSFQSLSPLGQVSLVSQFYLWVLSCDSFCQAHTGVSHWQAQLHPCSHSGHIFNFSVLTHPPRTSSDCLLSYLHLCPSLSPASEEESCFKPIQTSKDALGHPLTTGSLSSDHQLAIPIDFLSTFLCVILKYWEDLYVQSEHSFLRKGLGRYILISLNLFRAQSTFGGALFAKLPSSYPRKPISFF